MVVAAVVGDGFQRLPHGTRVPGTIGDLGKPWTEEVFAVAAAKAFVKQYPAAHLDVIEMPWADAFEGTKGQLVWCSLSGSARSFYAVPITVTMKGERAMGLPHDGQDLPQPINVDREQVVARLQEQLDEEKAEREKVEAKERQARLAVEQFITDHEDEIVEYLGRQFGGSWNQVAENLEAVFKDDAYKPAKLKKGRKETDLEKMVRVLAMSVDKTIEVQPSSSIYQLL